MAKEYKLSLNVPERLLSGVYANQMIVRHTREEFLVDFVHGFPPRIVVTARVIVSPGHLKRMIRALEENIGRYETTFGPLIQPHGQPAAQPGVAAAGPIGQPDAKSDDPSKKRQVTANVPEHILPGVYANQMVVSHTREEFLIDFANVFPPHGVVTARIFVSPDQLKRMIASLRDILNRYESTHGTIAEATVPQPDSFIN